MIDVRRSLAAAMALVAVFAMSVSAPMAKGGGNAAMPENPNGIPSVAKGGPSAHDPHFENTAWWPEIPENVGKPAAQKFIRAFEKQPWPKARLLVWAKPGTSGAGEDPASWLDGGKPAASPPDKDTDVLLPAADTVYNTGPSRKEITFKARHVTVERNARGGGYRYEIFGNVWVKEGGSISSGHAAGVSGPTNIFFRNDNKRDAKGNFAQVGQYMGVTKPGGSAEFIGPFQTTDEMAVASGTMILAPDSFMNPGPNSWQVIRPEGKLILLSGAVFQKRCGQTKSPNDIVVQGLLQAGMPERPLMKDAVLGISFKDAADAVGLRVEPTGDVKIFTTDPTKARLVIKWHENIQQNPGSTPHLVQMVFLRDLDLNGVVFDYVHKGGVRLSNPANRQTWKNIFFGDHNEGKPDELFAAYVPPQPKSKAAPAAQPKTAAAGTP
jgi:hypothetical protein